MERKVGLKLSRCLVHLQEASKSDKSVKQKNRAVATFRGK